MVKDDPCDFLKILKILIFFFRAPPADMEVPRLGVESELQLPAYITATAMWDLSRVCQLYHSSWQHWILNPLSEARDCTREIMDTSQVSLLLSHYWELRDYFFLSCFQAQMHDGLLFKKKKKVENT